MRVLLLSEKVGEEKMYVACLIRWDQVAQGHTPEEALHRLRKCMVAQALWNRIDGHEPFAGVSPIPDAYKEAYERAPYWEGKLPPGCDGWVVRISDEVLAEYVAVSPPLPKT